MSTVTATPASRVLAVLDDTAEGALVIEWSAALAHSLQRELGVVYVESTPALEAAALPGNRVLSHVGALWAPFTPPDVERGFRMQAQRLRALAGPISLRHAVNWSLRTVRGALPHAAFDLFDECDLMFVASPLPLRPLRPAPRPGGADRPARGWQVATLSDGSAGAARALHAAGQLAQALSVPLRLIRVAPGGAAGEAALGAALQSDDVLVLPRALALQHKLARVPCAVLLVA